MSGSRELVVIYDGPDACTKCLGWKRIANDDDQSPWKFWAELPPPSNLAVQLGLVVPIECPACHGTGRKTPAITNDDVKTAVVVLAAYVAGTLRTDLCDELDSAIEAAWTELLANQPPDDDYEEPSESPLTQDR